MEQKKLYRTEGRRRVLWGVCGGVAEYLDVDPTVVRVVWTLAAVMGSLGLWAYIICALIVPLESDLPDE